MGKTVIMDVSTFYPLLMVLPVGFLAILLRAWQQIDDDPSYRPSVQERDKSARPPGQAAFREVERLNTRIDDILFWFLCLPPLMAVSWLTYESRAVTATPRSWQGVLGFSVAIFAGLAMLLLAKIKERRRWQSNFCAQRAVGDMLSQLMLDGCRVFHGFRLPGYGKIDHVVVAPTGVYAVETEPRAANVRSRNKQMVNYDGKSLNFADGSDTGKLGQIRREAGRFSRVLTNALKIPIQVKPVIALPGGCVRITGEQPYDVLVINPRFLRDAIVTHGPVALGRDQIEKIAAHLDAKCRDVLVG